MSWLAERIMRGSAMGRDADRLVRGWLSANVDQSMVVSMFVERFGVDPLAHHDSLGADLKFWNKTGTEAGVRAEVGAATWAGRTVSWAAIANWQPELDEKLSGDVIGGMRRIGESALAALAED